MSPRGPRGSQAHAQLEGQRRGRQSPPGGTSHCPGFCGWWFFHRRAPLHVRCRGAPWKGRWHVGEGLKRGFKVRCWRVGVTAGAQSLLAPCRPRPSVLKPDGQPPSSASSPAAAGSTPSLQDGGERDLRRGHRPHQFSGAVGTRFPAHASPRGGRCVTRCTVLGLEGAGLDAESPLSGSPLGTHTCDFQVAALSGPRPVGRAGGGTRQGRWHRRGGGGGRRAAGGRDSPVVHGNNWNGCSKGRGSCAGRAEDPGSAGAPAELPSRYQSCLRRFSPWTGAWLSGPMAGLPFARNEG